MPEDDATSKDRPTPQADLIVPPTMWDKSSGPRPRAEHTEPKCAGLRAYLALIVLTLLAFAPILKSDLLWTQYDEVQRSPYSSMECWQDAWNIASIRQHDPITLTSYFAESLLPLPPATAHRLINLLLHLTAALLLLSVLQGLKQRGAFAAALVFALHPVVLQALYWPGYRNEMVGLIFILASLYFGIRNRNARDFLITLLLTCIGAIIHPAALAVPALLAMVIFYQHKTVHLHHFNRVLPLACVVLFIGVWTQSAPLPNPGAANLSQATIVGQNLYFYLRQGLLPLELKLFHPFSAGQSYNVGAANNLLGFLVFVPFYVLIALNLHRRWARGLLLGLTSFLLLLIYGLNQTGRFIDGSLAKEEYGLYVALPALIALIFCGLANFFGRRDRFAGFVWLGGFSLFLLAHFGLTLSYAYAHRDSVHLWQLMAGQWKNSWQPKAALVDAAQSRDSQLLSERDMIRTLEDILALNPQRHENRIELARRYRDSKQNTNAVREYQRILRETQPEDQLLQEAADFFDKLNLRWEATKARERIGRAQSPAGNT